MKAKKLWRLCALALAVMASLTACADKSTLSTDVLTQTVLSKDKIPITILVKYAFSINTFEAAAEKQFPSLDIIQVGNYTSDMGKDEYTARMKNDDLTDIVMSWPLEVGEEYWADRLIDLSSMPFTSQYTTSMLNNISRNGKLYYLPGPSQVRGIVYNKTLFEENNWQIPTDFNSFLQLCKTIEQSGIRALQLGLKNLEVLDTAFVGYGFNQSYNKPENAQGIIDFDSGNGSFADNYSPALDTFQTLIDNGILQKSDLSIDYSARENMLFNRQCAMIEDSLLIARMGNAYNGSTDEFALMPFFNPGSDSDWSRLYPVCYIGVNKHVTENQEKYDLIMQLLQYISTIEGQTALSDDTGATFSSLKGMAPPVLPEIENLVPSLTHGRFAVFPTLKNAQSALRNGLAGMVAGELTSADVIAMVDKENLSPPMKAPLLILGEAKEDFSLTDTANFITDAMRKQSGCEIALFLDNGKDGKYNGKGVSGRLYKGDLTYIDIKRILPDLKVGEKGEMQKITMTGDFLIKTLEYSIPVENNKVGWFYYFSGLKMEFDPCAEPGTRIHSITDDSGKKIDPDRVYTIAVPDESFPLNYAQTVEDTGISISAVFETAIVDGNPISPAKDGRFKIITP